MIIMPRIEDTKDFKIDRKVFDERTLLAIYKLLSKGIVKSVESFAMEGKESVVLSAKDSKDDWIALKVYRVEYCDFKSMWKYLVGDPRFVNIKKSRRAVVLAWCKREFKNLAIASRAGVSCPKPLAFNENILVLEFIGEKGKLASQLINVKLSPEDSQTVYDFILNEIGKMIKAGLVHSDLSAYNILIWGQPYIIDFSQAVPLQHQLAKEFLLRDIKNINQYFKRLGVKTKTDEELFDRFLSLGDFK